ncbi:phosphate ABC transporter permease PtsA [Haloplanus rubicundus]|uniref:Phosphate transport system permease protein PstA n=1 Tax=Haloplanus rubicundus TaxID=1547898 RepID=A0A345E532_9EURY|nr:phosphate ABC transporter permease PstA [Haloplanus rubicundus]AXG07304.1 phosphate ABC transporter permease PtsA [Haloplanus rubicundus]
MATRENVIEDFGHVSRTVGTVFRYLLLAATLFGIVALAVLLVYVANDAIQPLTADPGWHLTFFLTLVVPTLVVGGYLLRADAASFRFGASVVGLLAVSTMFAGGAAMIFVDIVSPVVWFSYVLALAIALAGVVVIERFDRRLPFLARFAGAGGVIVGSLLLVPGLVQALPVYPTDGIMLTLSLGAPVALVVGRYAAAEAGRRGTLLAILAGVVAVGTGEVLGPLLAVGAVPATVLLSVAVVPTGGYAVGAVRRNPGLRPGLAFAATILGGALVGAAAVEALGFAGPQSWLDWGFLTSAHSGTAADAGLYPAIGGSILLMVTVAALSFPLGVGAAVYLEEYAPDNRFTRFIDVNISNLAGVPSVVYGLLGLGVFVTYLGQPTGTVLIGGATLALLILPIVIISAREALRSVPNEMRQASYGMGATRWQTIKNVVLPRAFPGILTGTILALGRAIGETAPLIMIGAPNVLFSLPTALSSKVSAMPLQVYAWASLFASEPFYQAAVPAGVVVLLIVLLSMNSVAIVLRNKYQNNQ